MMVSQQLLEHKNDVCISSKDQECQGGLVWWDWSHIARISLVCVCHSFLTGASRKTKFLLVLDRWVPPVEVMVRISLNDDEGEGWLRDHLVHKSFRACGGDDLILFDDAPKLFQLDLFLG